MMEKAGREGDGAPCGPVLHIVVVGFHHKKGCQVRTGPRLGARGLLRNVSPPSPPREVHDGQRGVRASEKNACRSFCYLSVFTALLRVCP